MHGTAENTAPVPKTGQGKSSDSSHALAPKAKRRGYVDIRR
jgi:hypothetical protein